MSSKRILIIEPRGKSTVGIGYELKKSLLENGKNIEVAVVETCVGIQLTEESLRQCDLFIITSGQLADENWRNLRLAASDCGIPTVMVTSIPGLYGNRADHCIASASNVYLVAKKILEILK